jgi:hypothetical protein
VSTLSGAIGVGCCWLVAVVFAVSAAGKLRSAGARAAFRRSVADMKVLSIEVVGPAAAAVPIAEALAVVLLVLPPTAVYGCVLACVLLAAFTTGIVIVLRRGTRASCLCFGASERPFGARHVVRNVLFAAAALSGALLSAQPVDVPAALVAIAAGAIAALLVVTFDELLDLFGTPARS